MDTGSSISGAIRLYYTQLEEGPLGSRLNYKKPPSSPTSTASIAKGRLIRLIWTVAQEKSLRSHLHLLKTNLPEAYVEDIPLRFPVVSMLSPKPRTPLPIHPYDILEMIPMGTARNSMRHPKP